MARKTVGRAQQQWSALDESESFAFHQVGRNRLPVVLVQLRLVVEQIQLRRRAGHEQVNHALGLWREMRLLGGQRISLSSQRPGVEQRAQRQRSNAEAALAEKVPPRDLS